MDIFYTQKVQNFFEEVLSRVEKVNRPRSIVVTHLLEDRPYFLRALSKIAPIDTVFYKPKSVHLRTLDWSKEVFELKVARRDDTYLLSTVSQCMDQHPNSEYVFVDIGGYFQGLIGKLDTEKRLRVRGVVEDTENGLQKYLNAHSFDATLVSVARSPLKEPEDYLVGHSTVFSAEALTRVMGHTFHGHDALVVGFGKVGSAAADALRQRGMHVAVHDVDPGRLIFARSMGYAICEDLDTHIGKYDYICGATGNRSLSDRHFKLLKPGAIVFTVTSSDDELDTGGLQRDFLVEKPSPHVSKYYNDATLFYLLNHGQAVNFVHGAVVGPYIFLVQAEILIAVSELGKHGCSFEDYSLPSHLRDFISEAWLRAFC